MPGHATRSAAAAALLLVVGVAGGGAALAPKQPPRQLPREAVAAQREFVKAVEKADEEREKRVSAARAVLVKRLTPMVEAETKRGNLNGAIAVRDALQSAKTDGDPAVAAFRGGWQLAWTGGDGVTRCDFDDEGATIDDLVSPKVALKGGALNVLLVTREGGKHIHVYRPCGKYLLAEAWHDVASFDRGAAPAALGVASPAK